MADIQNLQSSMSLETCLTQQPNYLPLPICEADGRLVPGADGLENGAAASKGSQLCRGHV